MMDTMQLAESVQEAHAAMVKVSNALYHTFKTTPPGQIDDARLAVAFGKTIAIIELLRSLPDDFQ